MEGVFDQRRYLIPFRSTLLPQIFTDTLVVGAGVAGLRAAAAAARGGEVIVLSKSDLRQTNTAWAQGGWRPRSRRATARSRTPPTR